jgi:ribosomal protein S18 acetylase RimI-like enzyme
MVRRLENSSSQNAGPTEGLRYREADVSDQPTIQEILHQANLSFHVANASSVSECGDIGCTRVHVAERAEEILAVLQWRSLGEEAEILDLAVRVSVRGQGIASFLLREFLQSLREAGVRQILLEVRESNATATTLYRNFGFVAYGRRENYYRNPAEAALLLSLKVPG